MGDDGAENTDGYMMLGDIPTFKIYDSSENAYYDAAPSENIAWDASDALNTLDALWSCSAGIADGTCDCEGNVEDCAGECGGSAMEDECGVCNGDGSSCAPGVFGLALNGDGNLDVTFDSGNDIYGFQFLVTGVDVTGASGGAARSFLQHTPTCQQKVGVPFVLLMA